MLKNPRITLLFILLLPVKLLQAQNNIYFPPNGKWERRPPESLGIDAEKLAAAVELAKKNTVVKPHDMNQFIENSFGRKGNHFSQD